MKGRKVCALVLLMCFLLLVGCNKKEQSSEEGSKERIQFWIAENFEGEGEKYQKIVDEYNKKHADVLVEFSVKPWDKTPLNVALQSQEPPDVVSSWFSPPPDAYQNLRVNLLDYLTEAEKEDFGPQIIAKATKEGGKMYTWPYYTSQGTWILANGDILKKTGVAPEGLQENGWKWEEFVTLCKRVKQVGAYGYGDAQSTDTLNLLYAGLLGPVIFDKDGKLTFNWGDKRATAILENYYNLIYKDQVMPQEVLGVDIFGLHNKFTNGQFGIIRSYSAWISQLEKDGKISKVYVLPYPDQIGLKMETDVGLGGFNIFKKPNASEERIEKIIDFVRYLSRPHAGEFIPMQWIGLPAAESIRNSYISSLEIDDPNLKFMITKINGGRILPPDPSVAAKIREIIATYSSEAMSKKINPQQAITRWTKEIANLLRK